MVQYYEDLYRILSIYHYQWPPSLSHQHVVALIVNWPRDSIIPAALSSHAILVQQESKTRHFFFNPINVSTPPSDTKNTKSPDCLNSMFDPSSALNIKVFLTPQTRAITKEVQRPYCTLFCIQDSGRKVVQSVLENNDALHPIFGPFCVVHTQKLITATFQVV